MKISIGSQNKVKVEAVKEILRDYLYGSCAIKISIENMGAKQRPKVRRSPERASGRSAKRALQIEIQENPREIGAFCYLLTSDFMV